MSYLNIPRQLRALPQWVLFRAETMPDGKVRKTPINPITRQPASSKDPATWTTFDVAHDKLTSYYTQNNEVYFLGFCLRRQNGLVFMDLDNDAHPDQQKILANFDSYTQKSISGRGSHIIGYGGFDGMGAHPQIPYDMGLFKEDRFILMTGNVYEERRELKELNEYDLQRLHGVLGGSPEAVVPPAVELPPSEEDSAIIKRLTEEKGTRFTDTYNGIWEENYPSHSECDHAMISHFFSVTPSFEQIRRLFRGSPALTPARMTKKGLHDQGSLDRYVNRSITKIRVEREESKAKVKQFNWEVPEHKSKGEKADEGVVRDLLETMPDGIAKEIAVYTNAISGRSMDEGAIMVGLQSVTTAAGIIYYSPTGLGLNLFTILVGPTGVGKGITTEGFEAVASEVSHFNPYYGDHMMNSAASPESIEDKLAAQKCIHLHADEASTVYDLFDLAVNPAEARKWMDIFLKSYTYAGRRGSFKPRARALTREQKLKQDSKTREEKDEENAALNVGPVSFNFTGNTTDDRFLEFLTPALLDNGLVNRFIFITKKSPIVKADYSRTNEVKFPTHCAKILGQLRSTAVAITQEERIRIVYDSPDTEKYGNWIFEHYDFLREKVAKVDATRAKLLMRSADKTHRIASTLAVSANPNKPEITRHQLEWSFKYIERCDNDVLEFYDAGLIASGQALQQATILRFASEFREISLADRRRMLPDKFAVRDFVPEDWLRNRCLAASAFAKDRRSVDSFNRMLADLKSQNKVMEVTHELVKEVYGCSLDEIPPGDKIHKFLLRGKFQQKKESVILQLIE